MLINNLPTIPSSWKFIRISYTINEARGGSPKSIENYLANDINGYNWIKIGVLI